MRLLQARYVYSRRRLLGSLLLRLTKRRILHRRSHGKPHFAPVTSRKSALCTCRLTENRILRRRRHRDVTKRRILGGRRHGKAHFACGAHQKAHSACGRSRRVRLSVRTRAQNALFRRVCFSLPAQTWSHLTQRRILRRRSHVKAHSAPDDSRKSALCNRYLTEKRILYQRCHLDVTEKRILRNMGAADCAFS